MLYKYKIPQNHANNKKNIKVCLTASSDDKT